MLDPHFGTGSPTISAEAPGDLMLAEFAHRVANDMTIVMAELRTCRSLSRDAATADGLAAAIERLNNICIVQRRLARPEAGVVDLSVVLEELIEAIILARADPRHIGLVLKLPTLRVDARFAWRLATIIAELVTNSLKHGFAGREGQISLALDMFDATLSCIVADNGIGAGNWQAKGPGHGHLIVQAMVEEMGGSVHRLTSTAGTEVRLTFPRLNTIDQEVKGLATASPKAVRATRAVNVDA